MKKIVIGSVLAIAFVAFSGCSTKSCAPKLPTCVPSCKIISTPCGCPK